MILSRNWEVRITRHEGFDWYQRVNLRRTESRWLPFQAYVKAASYPNKGLICEQNVDEMKRVFNKKFPNRLSALDRFLSVALISLELVPIPTDENGAEEKIRDVDDRHILRAAIEAKADVVSTDNRFLGGITTPAIMHYDSVGFLT